MGHAIEYFDFDYKMSRALIEAEMDERAREEGDYSSGLYNRIRFISTTPLPDYEHAVEFIKANDRYSYDSLAVPYYEYRNSGVEAPQSLKTAREKAKQAHAEYETRYHRDYYTPETVKSRTIGCKKCESKLAVAYLRGNRCPLCNAELRPETELKYLDALLAKSEKAERALKAEEAKYQELIRKKHKQSIRWLVKIEYHC